LASIIWASAGIFASGANRFDEAIADDDRSLLDRRPETVTIRAFVIASDCAEATDAPNRLNAAKAYKKSFSLICLNKSEL
jgi:hypothetical protein